MLQAFLIESIREDGRLTWLFEEDKCTFVEGQYILVNIGQDLLHVVVTLRGGQHVDCGEER